VKRRSGGTEPFSIYDPEPDTAVCPACDAVMAIVPTFKVIGNANLYACMYPDCSGFGIVRIAKRRSEGTE
jgi:hypothetical protein